MTDNTKPSKKASGGTVLIEFPDPIYRRLSEEAQRLTDMEGRRVTVTEVVRRRAIGLTSEVAA